MPTTSVQATAAIESPIATLTPEPPTATPLPGSPETDREALIALYEATGGKNWRKKINWLSDAPIGQWHGVTTDHRGRVTELEFGEWTLRYALGDNPIWYDDHTGESYVTNNLKGKLPPELGHLSGLRHLRLEGEDLFGEIPPELGRLSNLETLNLLGNNLSGNIPAELENLQNLTILNLRENNLSGEIPVNLSRLEKLRYLKLGYNYFAGGIPPELGNLNNLVELDLSGNRHHLKGEIPPEIGNLTKLRILRIQNTRLTGCISRNLRGQLMTGPGYSDLGYLRFC